MSDRRRLELLERLREKLVCPSCRHDALDSSLACTRCGDQGRIVDGQRFEFTGLTFEEEKNDWLNAAKASAKRRLGRFYPMAMSVLAPVYGDSGLDEFVASFNLDARADLTVCDLGAGTRTYDNERVICVDGYAYDTVHLVCNLAALPFADGSIDGLVSEAVLEHVPDPAAHVAEMLRVLKPGGRVHCYFPFIVGFHASPHDYTRLTLPGLKELFKDFTIQATRVAGGPTSGLLWTLQEWLAIAGSFGSERLYRALVPLTWVLSPLKLVDAVLIKHPAAHVIASGFAIEAMKRA